MAEGDKTIHKGRYNRKASTPEARENQLIALTVDLAEKQLKEGTASSQTMAHYLKLSSQKERLELEILQLQKELIVAKTEAIKSVQNAEQLYQEAIAAMRKYSGNGGD